MQYSIRYKISSTRHGGFLWGKSNLFPVLDIRYRANDSKNWIHLGNAEIDLYTYHRFKNTYYKDFRKSATTMMTLETRPDYERLALFKEILDKEFSGSICKFVESIVREEVAMEKADEEERWDINYTVRSLVTRGLMTIDVQI